MHTSLATSILDQIKSRKLDLFFELEEKIMSKQTLDKSLMQVWLIIFVISNNLSILDVLSLFNFWFYFTAPLKKMPYNLPFKKNISILL